MNLLIFLLLLLAGQDDPARRLIRALGSDDIEEREEAARKLVELGEPALPLLKKAGEDTDAEVALRARLVAKKITLRRRVREALHGPRRVTENLVWTMGDTEDFLKRTFGLARLGPKPPADVDVTAESFTFKDASLWDVADRFAAAYGIEFPGRLVETNLPFADRRGLRWTTLGNLRVFALPGARRRLNLLVRTPVTDVSYSPTITKVQCDGAKTTLYRLRRNVYRVTPGGTADSITLKGALAIQLHDEDEEPTLEIPFEIKDIPVNNGP